MAVIVESANHRYDGEIKAAVDTVNGMFVAPDYVAGTAALSASGNYDGVCLLVDNVNFTIDQQGVSDIGAGAKAGERLRLKRLVPGDSFVTDQFNGTYGTISIGDVFAPGAAGKVEAKAARTPLMTFKVKSKAILWNNNALELVLQ